MTFAKRSIAIVAALFLLAATTQAQVFSGTLSGLNEVPPNISPGTGFAMITVNLATHTFRAQANFSGLLGTTTASHVHAPALPGFNAGVATQTPSFSGFPLGVTSGVFDMTFDMTLASTWNPAYIAANGGTPAGAEAAFVSALNNGMAYFNIHTSSFGGGEIRANLVIPEPTSVALFALGGLGLGLAAWKRRRS